MALLTLLNVRQNLWEYAYGKVPYSSASVAQKAAADFRINQVSERILESGKWKNTLRRISIPIYSGYITLPRELGTILGITLQSDSGCCCTSTIYSKFHEFAHGISCCSCGTYPISETAQTFITPTAPFFLRVKSTVTSGTVSFIGGWSTADAQYFDSVSLNITNGTTTTTRDWNVMPRIQKSITTVGVELYSVDSSGTETLIAVYGPNEEVPSYKKYKVPNWNSSFTSALVFGKLAFVPAVADSDIVVPSNFGALKIGLKALTSEDTEEDESAMKDWERAYAILNSELTEAEGDSEYPMFRVSSQFGAGGVPQVI